MISITLRVFVIHPAGVRLVLLGEALDAPLTPFPTANSIEVFDFAAYPLPNCKFYWSI